MRRSVRVLFANSDEDLVVELQPADTETSLVEKVRKFQGWAADVPVRFIHAGRDLFEDEKASRLTQVTVHCIYGSPKSSIGELLSRDTSSSCGTIAPVDWLDRVNPATFILCIAAVIITPLCIQNTFSGEGDHSTKTSLALAFVMSGIYGCVFYPCFRWPQWVQNYSARWKQPWDLDAESLEGGAYDFTEEQLYDDTMNLTGSWSRLYRMKVPERPPAPMICPPIMSRKDL